jgi:hypothetical protein
MRIHKIEVLLSRPIILLEERTLEGGRSVARILLGTIVAVGALVGSGVLLMFISDFFNLDKSGGFFISVFVLIIYFGAIFFAGSLASKFLPWKKPRIVMCIRPDGKGELFAAPDLASIGGMIGKPTLHHKFFSRITQYQEDLKHRAASWVAHTDQGTQRWTADLTHALEAENEVAPVFNPNFGLHFDENGISVVLFSSEDSPQRYHKAHVLIVKAESTLK